MDRDHPRDVNAPCPVERIRGPNAVVVEFLDETETYGYANLLRVAVRMRARIPGSDQPFEHRLERVGVLPEERHAVCRAFVERMKRNLLPYLFRPDFPRRYLAHRNRSQARIIPFPEAP